jgi:phosphatidate cytidylyltransferase
MPFNPAVFRKRALTAMVFVAVMLTGLLWNGWSFLLLFTVIHFGCWYEYNRLMEIIHPEYLRVPSLARILVMFAGWMMMIMAAGELLPVLKDVIGVRTSALACFVLLASALAVISQAGSLRKSVISIMAIGLAYISLSWALLVYLRSGAIWTSRVSDADGFAGAMDRIGHTAGYAMPLVIIATIWLNDTMAYLVGSFIGKTPLSPISPKKTLEGTVGGVLISVALVTVGVILWIGARPLPIASVAAVTAVAGTFGDLLESKLKRMAGVKDSGTFMPGHGGFLDRFDSLLLATPFAWIFCTLFLR